MSNRAFICALFVFVFVVASASPVGADHPNAVRPASLALTQTAALATALEATAREERLYRVTGVTASYVHLLGGLPSLDEDVLRTLELALALVDNAYGAPDEGEAATLSLADVSAEAPVWLTAGGVNALAAAIADAVSARLDGAPIFAAVDPRDIDPSTGRDLRGGRGGLRFRVEYTGPVMTVSAFEPEFVQPLDPDPRPSIGELMNEVVVELVRIDGAYVAWRPAGTAGAEWVSLTLAEIADRPEEQYTASAVQQVSTAVRDYLSEDAPGRGYIGILVRPDVSMDPMPLRIVIGEVAQVRTLAAGERIGVEGPDRINHPKHSRILEHSPVAAMDEDPSRSLLNKRDLDEYVFFLQRHPGRRVDVALAPGAQPNTVNVDYLITENKSWLIYGQVSNTGTRQTGRIRARFGFMHTQLTGNDDILSLDYNTAEFSDTHAITGSYEARVLDCDRLRWRVHGIWSEFEASDVGIPFLEFNGDSWMVGTELMWSAYQDRNFFLDVVGGARFMHVSVENLFAPPGIDPFPISQASEDFLIPYAGLRMQKRDDKSSVTGALIFEGSVGDLTGLDRGKMSGLGRPLPAKDWLLMQWDLGASFFLEPLLNPEDWSDPSTPASSTLAHEIILGVKGQYAFGNRLVPQVNMVAGGMFSVRGYPESIVSGDTVVIGTAEYRFHLPRIFRPDDEATTLLGAPFRWSPQHVYGRPDWDLILRGFVDAAHTRNSDPLDFEVNHTLIGAGVGVELAIRRNVNLRVDWGFALRGVETASGGSLVDSGSNRVHFAATFLY